MKTLTEVLQNSRRSFDRLSELALISGSLNAAP